MCAQGANDVESHNGSNFAQNRKKESTLVCFLFPESQFLPTVCFLRTANLGLFSHFCRKRQFGKAFFFMSLSPSCSVYLHKKDKQDFVAENWATFINIYICILANESHFHFILFFFCCTVLTTDKQQRKRRNSTNLI